MKRFFTLLLFCVFVLTLSASAASFSDMPNDWSTAALESAVENGLLTGDGNLLKPRDTLTRAQMATIVVRALGAEKVADITEFTDIPENAWYRDEMAKAYYMNVFRGDGAGHMNPEKPVSREEAFVVLSRVLLLENAKSDVLDGFSDKALVSDWAKAPICAMVEKGYVNGSDGKLNPKGNITRAEFAQLMYNLVALYIDSPEDLAKLPDRKGNVILRENISLKDVDVKGDLIVADGVAEDVSFENVQVDGRLVVRAESDLRFSGKAHEIVSSVDGFTLTLSKDAEVSKITLTGKDSLSVIEKDEVPPVTPPSDTPPVVTPPIDDDDEEEEIWTGFH